MPKSKSEKYVGSPLDDRLGTELADKLDLEMKQRQLFLQNDLSLTDLADIMGLSTRHLSQVINQHRHRNFYDYVNSYRAHHAANYLVSHGKTNLTRLAYESGFNNRVSFSKAFRSHTGQTPTEFISKQTKVTTTR
jgi:AraC-like DNA-binding protein